MARSRSFLRKRPIARTRFAVVAGESESETIQFVIPNLSGRLAGAGEDKDALVVGTAQVGDLLIQFFGGRGDGFGEV